MTQRTDLPRIPSDKEPSYLNKEALGNAIGSGAVVSLINGLVGVKSRVWYLSSILGGMAAGGILGGISGKKRETHEQKEGKVVEQPSYLNDGILNGFVGTLLLSDIITLITKKNQLGGLANVFGVSAIMGAVGSILTKNARQAEFDQAVALRNQREEALYQRLEAFSPQNDLEETNHHKKSYLSSFKSRKGENVSFSEKIQSEKANLSHEMETTYTRH